MAAFLLLALLSFPALAGPGEYGLAGCVVSREITEGAGLGSGPTFDGLEVTLSDPDSCGGWLLLPAVEYHRVQDLPPVDWEVAAIGTGGVLLLWATGLGLGALHSILRKGKPR